MDEQLRRLERLASSGDYYARVQWKTALLRAGLPDPDAMALAGPLTLAEEIQEQFDDIWWHRRKCLRLDWDGDPINSGGLYKAHHPWGHRGWGAKNSKRQTLRTHRDGSRRDYQLRDKNNND